MRFASNDWVIAFEENKRYIMAADEIERFTDKTFIVTIK